MSVFPGFGCRVRSIDWLRGTSVLLMIQAHALVLLRPELHRGALFRAVDWLDGLVAPAFILASGFSLSWAQLGRARRPEKSLLRIAQVLGVALLVNGMWFSFIAEPWRLLRMDILHAIGVGLFGAWALGHGLARHPSWIPPTALGVGVMLLGAAPLCAELPAPWAHLLNKRTDSLFPLLPWTGYSFLGLFLGAAASRAGLRRAVVGLVLVGLTLWAAHPWLQFYPPHDYYEFHPSVHGLRLATVCAALWLLCCIEAKAGAPSGWFSRWLERLSALSLPVYVFHLALLHYSVAGPSLAQLWRARSGWSSYLLLTVLLTATSIALSLALRATLHRFRRTCLAGRSTLAPTDSVLS
jgi:uncharacterized membrane protein